MGRKPNAKKSTEPAGPPAPPPGVERWPTSNPETRKVAQLLPYAHNARTHSPEQVDKIAASIREWGWTNPVLIDERNVIIAGHGRVLAAQLLKLEEIPVLVARGWTEAQKRAYVIADNKLALEAGWDIGILSAELGALATLKFDLGLTGFGDQELGRLLIDPDEDELEHADEVKLPELQKRAVSRTGDLWILGPHRILVGDSTEPETWARLMAGEVAACVIADPPYGMGKESAGVANDNLYRDELDAFQMKWWRAVRAHVAENGSAYVWGNAPDLWRLWYLGGLNAEERLTVRNEIVWAKSSAPGMASEDAHCYAPETERCLFLMRGQQFLGNQNLDEYWEGWEPLRAWLCTERDKMGWKASDMNRITGTQMAGHWFGKSQFQPIRPEYYAMLQKVAEGRAFVEGYDQLFGELFPDAKAGGEAYRATLGERIRSSRTYFDGAHDAMTDVWRFNRVAGEERFGHATPKPVAMMGRAVRSSVPEGGLFVDPFLGTGPCLIAGDLLKRRCYAVELEPTYVDIAIRRWEARATEPARLDGDGRTFAEVSAARTELAAVAG